MQGLHCTTPLFSHMKSDSVKLHLIPKSRSRSTISYSTFRSVVLTELSILEQCALIASSCSRVTYEAAENYSTCKSNVSAFNSALYVSTSKALVDMASRNEIVFDYDPSGYSISILAHPRSSPFERKPLLFWHIASKSGFGGYAHVETPPELKTQLA